MAPPHPHFPLTIDLSAVKQSSSLPIAVDPHFQSSLLLNTHGHAGAGGDIVACLFDSTKWEIQ
jgi:hypothetical protein